MAELNPTQIRLDPTQFFQDVKPTQTEIKYPTIQSKSIKDLKKINIQIDSTQLNPNQARPETQLTLPDCHQYKSSILAQY
jgi:hypothetical protein